MISVIGVSSSDAIQAARVRGSPVKPMASDRKAAPMRIKAIMAEVRVAPSSDWLKLSQVKERCAPARSSAPITPKAAASVAVAKPRYIEPMTSSTSRATGIKNSDAFSFSNRVVLGSGGGTCSGLRSDQMAM